MFNIFNFFIFKTRKFHDVLMYAQEYNVNFFQGSFVMVKDF